MIAYVRGLPLISKQKLVLITENGVGYEVMVGSKILLQAQAHLGQTLELFTSTQIRQDSLELFGFITQQDKELFEIVLGVAGVGPKTALAMVEAGSQALIAAVQNADVAFFTTIPRVGKKLAQKTIIELRSKLGEIKALDLSPQSQLQIEVSEALITLGFSDQDISQALQLITVDELDLETAVKQAIKIIGKQ